MIKQMNSYHSMLDLWTLSMRLSQNICDKMGNMCNLIIKTDVLETCILLGVRRLVVIEIIVLDKTKRKLVGIE